MSTSANNQLILYFFYCHNCGYSALMHPIYMETNLLLWKNGSIPEGAPLNAELDAKTSTSCMQILTRTFFGGFLLWPFAPPKHTCAKLLSG